MCVSIFVFLNRRVGPALAAVGMLLPMTVPLAYSYAYEARGYGMALGLCGAAVVCWDLADATRWRRAALLGLPICLAAAVANPASRRSSSRWNAGPAAPRRSVADEPV
jgi:hypothetical protein